MGGNHHLKRWHGLSRDEVVWYPIVESCLCDGCGLCVTSCPTGALAFDFNLKIPFVEPLRCLIGCSTCATLCPTEAIHVPDRKQLQAVIEQHHLDVVARSELRRRRKRFAGVLPEPHYPEDVSRNQN